jgi:hypothetical protein
MTCQQKPVAEKTFLAALEASITGYYDSLSDAEVEETDSGVSSPMPSWRLSITRINRVPGRISQPLEAKSNG